MTTNEEHDAISCPACAGKGILSADENGCIDCPDCEGTGLITLEQQRTFNERIEA